MRKASLAGLAIAIAIAIAAWWWLHRGDDRTASSTASPPAAGSQATPGAAPAAPRLPDRRTASDDPDPGVRTYVSGEVEVRDHRGSGGPPRDLPPSVHAPQARQLPSSLTHAITAPLRANLLACVSGLAADARGPRPKLEGVLTVAIHDHQLAITGAALQLRDASGPTADATRDCVAQKSIGATVPAPDQDDLDNYSISVTFAIP